MSDFTSLWKGNGILDIDVSVNVYTKRDVFVNVSIVRRGKSMRIGVLAEKTGVSERSLRHYEQQHLLVSTRLKNGYRDFDESMVERVKQIQLYLSLGLNLEQVAIILKCLEDKPLLYEEPCSSIIDMYEQKLSDVNEQIALLSTIKQNLEDHVGILKENAKKQRI